MRKTVSKIACVIAVVILAWVAVSFVEVLCKNLSGNPDYLPFNVFSILFR